MRDRQRYILRKVGWLLFWLLTGVALLVVLLFAHAAVPVLTALAQGGEARVWFFGSGAIAALASALYLVAAIAMVARRLRRGRRSD